MPDTTNHHESGTAQNGVAAAQLTTPQRPLATVEDIRPSDVAAENAVQKLEAETASRLAWESHHRIRRRRFRFSLMLFLLTFASTTLVGADYWPLDIMPGFFNSESQLKILNHLNRVWPAEPGVVMTIHDRFWQSIRLGCTYSCPLMLILLCHEMGHYLQAVRNRVPASFPFFIPLPLPPLGTMGAVILQGRGAADRRKMFDIAVSGPIAGLVVTIPILYYGIQSSQYVPLGRGMGFEFGQPVLVQWLIELIHGPARAGMTFEWNGAATAGWVGVFITAMNLLPIGQLDGGHLMYTLIGRKSHWIAWSLILLAVGGMIYSGMYSYILLLILLTLTGPRHPPTANDDVPLGAFRHVIGWLTLGFLLIGFTPQPIIIPERRPADEQMMILEPLQNSGWLDFELPESSVFEIQQ